MLPYQHIFLPLISTYIVINTMFTLLTFSYNSVHCQNYLETPLFKRKLTMLNVQITLWHSSRCYFVSWVMTQYPHIHCQQYLFTLSSFLHHVVRTVNFRPCSLVPLFRYFEKQPHPSRHTPHHLMNFSTCCVMYNVTTCTPMFFLLLYVNITLGCSTIYAYRLHHYNRLIVTQRFKNTL